MNFCLTYKAEWSIVLQAVRKKIILLGGQMKTFRIIILIFPFVIFLSLNLLAQAPDTLWTRTYGNRYVNKCYSTKQTTDGGYIIVGETKTDIYSGLIYIYLIRTNSIGDTIWTRIYRRGCGYSVEQTIDGGFIIVGESYGDICLVKTNENGDSLWINQYGGPWTAVGYAVKQTSDRRYIITGQSSPSGGSPRFYLLKTDSLGNLAWSKTYRNGHGCGYSVIEAYGSGFIAVGEVNISTNNDDLFILKTNNQGDSIWAKTYGGQYLEEGYSIQRTTDNNYIIAGATLSFGAGVYDFYLLKTNQNGDTLWTKTYGGTHKEEGQSVQQTFDNGYILTGWKRISPDNYDLYLVKTDSQGTEIWSRTYGGLWDDFGYSVENTSDGGYIVAGYTESFGAGAGDAWILKMESEDTIPPIIDSTTIWGNTSSPGPFPVYTKISDLLGIDTVLLYYKRLEDTQWMSTAMTEVEGTWYYGEIPSVSLPEDTVKYYIYSKDKAQPPNESTDPPGAPSNYYSFVANSAGIIEDGVTKAESTVKNLKISPNPFTHTVLIEGYSKATICDISGRIIAEVKSNKWDGRNKKGHLVPPGIYFLKADGKYIGKAVKVR